MAITEGALRKALGRRLAAIRKSRGMVQEDMGAWDINPRYYARVERGEVNVSFEKLFTIAHALDAPLSQIFLFPLESKRGTALSTDELLSVLLPIVENGDEDVIASLTNVIREFARSAKITQAPALRAAQQQRSYTRKKR
jgi:transcriptional regulator with XRE-family HTH domain